MRSNQKHYFCSPFCRHAFYNNRYDIGICESCGGVIKGQKYEQGIKKHCSFECRTEHKANRLIEPTGPFREDIEEYLDLNTNYEESTLVGVRTSLIHFFTYVAQEEKLTRLEDIRPSVVSRFMAHEQKRGMSSLKSIAHITTFFRQQLLEGRVDMANPVVPRLHNYQAPPASPRPYRDREIDVLWNYLRETQNSALLLAFALGLECGLRVGEVANIRLCDVDLEEQKIFVRLPTKNKRTRTVPFHKVVATQLEAWLKVRSVNCQHDHLLHTKWLKAFKSGSLCELFRKAFDGRPAPGDGFSFHRLRHSWATRLMNNGLELAVLKELGGWVSWSSMQRYIQVLDETVQRQYQASYAKLEKQQQKVKTSAPLSLLEFALLSDQSVNHSAAEI